MPGIRSVCLALLFLILCTVAAANVDVKSVTNVYHDLLSLVPDSVLDSRMKTSFKDVIQFADKIFSRVDKIQTHPLPVNLGLLRLYALQTNLNPIPAADHDPTPELGTSKKDNPAHISEELVAEALHYYDYAIQAYNANPRIIQQDIMLNNLPDKQTSNIKVPRHVVFLDHTTRSIVISVRGTASVSDMLTDLYIEPYPFLEASRGLFAHHGMAESAEALLPLVTTAILEIRQRTHTESVKTNSSLLSKLLDRKSARLRKYRDYRVVVTGHSLGAGTASLLAILLCMKSNITATAFAYAPPPVVSTLQEIPHLKARKWQIPLKVPFVKRRLQPQYQIHSFVHNNDIISRSSHTQILSLVSALVAVDQVPWGALDRAGMLLRNSLSAEEVGRIRQALEHRKHLIEGNDRELFIPGDIYLLRPHSGDFSTSASADRELHSADKSVPLANAQDSTSTTGSLDLDKRRSGSLGPDSETVALDVTAIGTAESSTPVATSTAAASIITTSQKTFDLFGTSLITQLPQLPQLPSLPQLPPQLLEALQSLLNTSSESVPPAAPETPSASGMDTFRDQNTHPSANHTDEVSNIDKNNLSGAHYRCTRVSDPRSLFNGLMYYGDDMVRDHLTAPFERALLLISSNH